jgi:MraZ protein
LYYGRHDHSMDQKGRVSVPAQFRDRLLDDLRLVIAPFTVLGERCLDVYPFAEWESLLRRFAAAPRFNAKTIKFQMGYLARSHPCTIDPAGRILVPPYLRQHAELKKDVVFLGVDPIFRLMDRERFEKVMGEHDTQAAEDPAIYEDLGF